MWLIKINISDCHRIVLFYSNFVRNILIYNRNSEWKRKWYKKKKVIRDKIINHTNDLYLSIYFPSIVQYKYKPKFLKAFMKNINPFKKNISSYQWYNSFIQR